MKWAGRKPFENGQKLRGAFEFFYCVAISICGLMARGALIIRIGTLNYKVSCGLF